MAPMRSQHAAPRGKLRSSRQRLMQLTIPTPLKSSLLARALDWSRPLFCAYALFGFVLM